MARYIGPVCKLCRREGVKLFLKGERCYTKCPIDRDRAAVPPGQKKMRRAKVTEYAKRLREKQKTRRLSGVLEKQFRRYFALADRAKGQTGENLLRILELRLDNIVRRLGFASSLAQARQLIVHGHIFVDGHRVDRPSYQVSSGSKVELTRQLNQNSIVQRALAQGHSRGLPSWLQWDSPLEDAVGKLSPGTIVDLGNLSVAGHVRVLPRRDEMSFPVNEQLIVELYSK